MYEVGPRYTGEITTAALIESSMKGTPGLELYINGEQGATSYTVWLTPKNRERAERDLGLLGVRPGDLKLPTFWENVGTLLSGKPICFGFAEEDFNGKKRLKISYIAGPKSESAGNLAAKAAGLFGSPAPADDADIPF